MVVIMNSELMSSFRLLIRDRLVQGSLAFLGVFVMVVIAAQSSSWTPGALLSLTDSAILVLTMTALLWGRGQLRSAPERRFWDLLALAWLCWVAVDFFFYFDPPMPLLSASFVTDLLYVLFYFLFALAIDQRPHLDVQHTLRASRHRLESAAGLAALFGLLTYFAIVVLPEPLGLSLSFVSRERGFTPMLLVRFSLDLLLLARLVHAGYTSRGRWRYLYSLLGVAMALYAVRDLVSVLQYEGVVSIDGLGVGYSLFSHLPWLAIVLAARARHLPLADRPVREVEATPRDGEIVVRATPLAVYALVVPVVHFLFFGLGLLDPATRVPRELFCLVYVAVLGVIAWIHQGVLEEDRSEARKSLEEAEERLLRSQRLESIGRLAGGIAHDFNNYLTVIRCWGELLRESLVDPESRSQIGHIENAASKAAHLTSQLLAIGRRQVLRPEALDLNAVILDTSDMLSSMLGEDVTFKVDLDPDLGLARADLGQTEQILVNLAVNSRHAMVGGGTLKLRTMRIYLTRKEAARLDIEPGPYISLVVSDTGCGMTQQVLEQAFEPFFTTRERGQGTGLGLSTVYGIVAQSGGAVSIESTPGTGTSVRVLLPTADGLEDDETEIPEPDPSIETDSARLLVVEDKDEVRRLAVRILKGGGFEVLQAAGGRAALDQLADDPQAVDLVITDVVMPEMDGVELAKTLLANRPGLRLLFVSGYPAEIRRERQLVLPTSIPLLQKPFTASGLISKVRRVLQEPPPNSDSGGLGI